MRLIFQPFHIFLNLNGFPSFIYYQFIKISTSCINTVFVDHTYGSNYFFAYLPIIVEMSYLKLKVYLLAILINFPIPILNLKITYKITC